MDYIITNHARERFVERFSGKRKEFMHLSNCSEDNCEKCKDLIYSLERLSTKDRYNLDKTIIELLNSSQETKIFYNDFNFMSRMYERHGYKKFKFLYNEEIIFPIIEDRGKKIVLTCMCTNYKVNNSTIFSDYIKRPKFKKKGTKSCD